MNDAPVTESLADGNSLADCKSGDDANSMEDMVQGEETGKTSAACKTAGNVVEQHMSMDGHVAQAQALGLYDVPSRRLSLLVEGRDYLKYRETFERLLFSEKMTPAQKDARILKLAMACLIEKMDVVSAATGEPFVKAEMLAG